MDNSLKALLASDEEKRATYVQAFGKEFDDPKRKQLPLPLDIAYRVALYKIDLLNQYKNA